MEEQGEEEAITTNMTTKMMTTYICESDVSLNQNDVSSMVFPGLLLVLGSIRKLWGASQ